MPTLQLDLDDDVISILEDVAKKVIHSELIGDVSQEERIQIAVMALVNSYDSGEDDHSEAPGEPIDAAALQEAVRKTLNPDISTDFTPPTGDVTREEKKLTIEDIRALGPNSLVKKYDEMAGDDLVLKPFLGEAICAVFAATPRNEWEDELVKDLVAKTAGTLIGRAREKTA